MGTSISQSSPRNTNWSPVHTGYRSRDIPEDRIVREIWRAFDNESVPISTTLKGEAFYDCYNTVKNAQSAQSAFQVFDSLLISQVTYYVISRDISGFVGDKYRNKTIADVIRFKGTIAENIDSIVRTEHGEINSKREWNSFVDRTIKKLKTK
jgi:hypothetical protein